MDWHAEDAEMYKIFSEFLKHEKPDLIHFHSIQRLTASIVQAALDLSVPYVITIHDAWWISDFQFLVDPLGNVYPNGHVDKDPICLLDNVSLIQSTVRREMLKKLLLAAEEVYVVSESFNKIYQNNGISNTITIRNGISDFIEQDIRYCNSSKNIVIGHVGGLAEHKGYYRLLEAIKNIQTTNIEFLIVDLSKDESYTSTQYYGDIKIKYVGRHEQSRVSFLYSSIDVLIAPSIWPESFGLVTREAAACGCWIIASNVGAIGEDVNHNVDGFVIDPEIQSIADIINKIDKNPQRFKNRVKKSDVRYSSSQSNDLLQRYRQILAQ